MKKLDFKQNIHPMFQTRDLELNLLLGEINSNMLDSSCHCIESGIVWVRKTIFSFDLKREYFSQASVIIGNTGGAIPAQPDRIQPLRPLQVLCKVSSKSITVQIVLLDTLPDY